MRKINRATAFCTAIFCIAAGGCAGGKYLEAGKKAENRNDPAGAYEHYCRAAATDPDNATAADGLARTRGAAAAYWERLALGALDEGKTQDAWRMLMRTLEIQPDHATAAQMLRQMEQVEPQRLALLRTEYIRRGPAMLRMGSASRLASAAPMDANENESADETTEPDTRPEETADSRPVLVARAEPESEKVVAAPLASQVKSPEPVVVRSAEPETPKVTDEVRAPEQQVAQSNVPSEPQFTRGISPTETQEPPSVWVAPEPELRNQISLAKPETPALVQADKSNESTPPPPEAPKVELLEPESLQESPPVETQVAQVPQAPEPHVETAAPSQEDVSPPHDEPADKPLQFAEAKPVEKKAPPVYTPIEPKMTPIEPKPVQGESKPAPRRSIFEPMQPQVAQTSPPADMHHEEARKSSEPPLSPPPVSPAPKPVERSKPPVIKSPEPRPVVKAEPSRPTPPENKPVLRPSEPRNVTVHKAAEPLPPPRPPLPPAPAQKPDELDDDGVAVIPGHFIAVHTYSKRDERFPRKGPAIDGINLNLKDTEEHDGAVSVDLDLENGKERVKKIRDLRVGRTQSFRGASGKVWRLTILSAHQKTHTVRIGFRGLGQ